VTSLDKKRAKIAEMLGLDWEPPASPEPRTEANDLVSRESEAVLAHVKYAKKGDFLERICLRCDAIFMANLANVAYCSDTCRQKELADMGIRWDSTKPATERWGIQGSINTVRQLNRVPLVIPTESIPILEELNLKDLPEPTLLSPQNLAPELPNDSESQLSVQELLGGNIDDLLG
jgi:hypothetical protein